MIKYLLSQVILNASMIQQKMTSSRCHSVLKYKKIFKVSGLAYTTYIEKVGHHTPIAHLFSESLTHTVSLSMYITTHCAQCHLLNMFCSLKIFFHSTHLFPFTPLTHSLHLHMFDDAVKYLQGQV